MRRQRLRHNRFCTTAFLRCILLGIFTTQSTGCEFIASIDTGRGPKNVILISIDTLRPDRLGAYGASAPTSPTLDKLAAGGVLYNNAFATSPWTLPSHASMLTGLYPNRHGLKETDHKLSEKIPTVTSVLAKAGFATAGFVSSSFLNELRGLHQGFESFHYEQEIAQHGNVIFVRNSGPEITTRALEWLSERDDQPFFLFVHYYDPHSDYSPSREYRRMFVKSYSGTSDGSTVQLRQVAMGQRKLTEEDTQHLLQLYDAEIRQLDDELARLVQYLDERGLSDNTALVITSDHGEEFMEHGRTLHGRTFFSEVIDVPLILHGPGVPSGLRIDDLASVVDVTPTILGLLDIEPPANLQGIDLSKNWSNEGGSRHTFVVAEALHEVPGDAIMIQDERYKLIYERLGARARLYDLELDPMEQRDISSSHPEPLAKLMAALRTYRQTENTAHSIPTRSASEEALLRRLGYLD